MHLTLLFSFYLFNCSKEYFHCTTHAVLHEAKTSREMKTATTTSSWNNNAFKSKKGNQQQPSPTVQETTLPTPKQSRTKKEDSSKSEHPSTMKPSLSPFEVLNPYFCCSIWSSSNHTFACKEDDDLCNIDKGRCENRCNGTMMIKSVVPDTISSSQSTTSSPRLYTFLATSAPSSTQSSSKLISNRHSKGSSSIKSLDDATNIFQYSNVPSRRPKVNPPKGSSSEKLKAYQRYPFSATSSGLIPTLDPAHLPKRTSSDNLIEFMNDDISQKTTNEFESNLSIISTDEELLSLLPLSSTSSPMIDHFVTYHPAEDEGEFPTVPTSISPSVLVNSNSLSLQITKKYTNNSTKMAAGIDRPFAIPNVKPSKISSLSTIIPSFSITKRAYPTYTPLNQSNQLTIPSQMRSSGYNENCTSSNDDSVASMISFTYKLETPVDTLQDSINIQGIDTLLVKRISERFPICSFSVDSSPLDVLDKDVICTPKTESNMCYVVLSTFTAYLEAGNNYNAIPILLAVKEDMDRGFFDQQNMFISYRLPNLERSPPFTATALTSSSQSLSNTALLVLCTSVALFALAFTSTVYIVQKYRAKPFYATTTFEPVIEACQTNIQESNKTKQSDITLGTKPSSITFNDEESSIGAMSSVGGISVCTNWTSLFNDDDDDDDDEKEFEYDTDMNLDNAFMTCGYDYT